ncbi:MAG: DUF7507 domain-containing protein [Christensenellales bacterium]|jgi:hypothetical protein
MRRRLFFALMSLLLFAGQVSFAENAPPVSVTSSIEPSGMVTAGEAWLRIAIQSNGATALRICRTDGTVVMDLGDVESYTYANTVQVTDAELDEGILRFVVQYTYEGKRRSADASVKVVRLQAAPSIAVSRSVSAPSAEIGSTVTVVYRVQNTGNVLLTDVALSDGELCGATDIGSLDAGDERLIVRECEMREGFSSAPRVSAKSAFGGVTDECAPYAVDVSEAALALRIECDRQGVGRGETAHLRYVLTNTGSAPLSGILVTDDTLGEIGYVPHPLEAGKSCTLSREIIVQETKAYRATAVCDGAKAYSNAISVLAYTEAGGEALALSASAERDAAGTVRAEIAIDNRGGDALRSVAISERDAGLLRTLDFAAAGETRVPLEFQSDKAELTFMATYTDAEGGKMTVISAPVEVQVGFADTAAVPPRLFGGRSYTPSENAVYPRMIAGVLIVISALLGVFVAEGIGKRRLRKKRKEESLRMLRRTKQREKALQQDSMATTREHQAVQKAGENSAP